jgi:hypothetical protein
MTVGDDSAPFFPEIPSPLAGEGEDEGVNINEVGFILGDAVGKLVANHIESNDEAGKGLALSWLEESGRLLSHPRNCVIARPDPLISRQESAKTRHPRLRVFFKV